MITAKLVIKRILEFFQGTADSLVALVSVLLFSDLRVPFSRHPLIPHQDCVILGNGPSLKESLTTHADFLQGKSTMCTNDFIDSPFFNEIKPDYYIFMDPVYWARQASPRFQSLFHHYVERLSIINWPLIIILPTAAKQWSYFQDIPKLNKNIAIRYVNTTHVKGPRWLRFWLYNVNLAMPLMHNVLVAATYLAIHLKFKRIYLLGGDHSWFKNLTITKKNLLTVTNMRAHDQESAKSEPFYQDSEETQPYQMHTFFLWLTNIFQGYHELEKYARTTKSHIFNASASTFIDSFERVDLNDPRSVERAQRDA